MLNVAVSRAKSSFVVIGNAGVFQKIQLHPQENSISIFPKFNFFALLIADWL
jgi:superfamily I DNA and/or RNA helicase